jgi:hypothetical protein
MTTRLGLVLLVWWGTSGFTVIQDAPTQTPIRWPTTSVTFVVQEDGSDDVADGSDVTAVVDALEAWNLPGCSDFTYVNGGTSPSRAIAQDGINRITFLESNWPGGANGAGAFTVRYRNTAVSPSVWSEADIRINGEGYSWSTNGTVNTIDVQSVVVHELGHALGLAHSANAQATMYFVTSRGFTSNRTLHPDDVAGLCFLYPAAAMSCVVDGDCPLLDSSYGGTPFRQRCDNGTCAAGPAAFGAECFSNSDCVSGACSADPVGAPASDPMTCVQGCTVGAGDCPAGSFCSAVDGTPRCHPQRDCVTADDCGGVNPVCRRTHNGRYTCVRACEENRHCPMGQVCFLGMGMPPAGFCSVPGLLAAGSPCQDGADCQSLRCTGAGVTPTCGGGEPGFEVDAGPGLPDAAGVDAAQAPDAAIAVDAAVLPDAAVVPDAAVLVDAAVVPDAAAPVDAAVRPDANVAMDASVPRDAAMPADAAVVNGGASTPPPDEPAGCTCGSSGAENGVVLLALLVWTGRRFRRRS